MLAGIKRTEWIRVAGLVGILVLAAALRGHLTTSGLEGVVFPRHDESHYVPMVVGFLQGQWEVGYFINPTFYMYLLYAATALTGLFLVAAGKHASWEDFVLSVRLDPDLVTIVGRSVTLAASLISIVLVYCIGRRMFSSRVGLIAALALALDRTHLQRSTLAGNEVVLVMLLLIFFLVLIRYVERPSTRLHVACGLLLGLAMSTKYSGGIHLVTLAVGSLWAAVAARTDRSLVGQIMRPRYWVAFPCVLAAFVMASPRMVLAYDTFRTQFARQASFLRDGYRYSEQVAGEYGWITYVHDFPVGNLGLFFAVLCALGILAASWRSIRERDSNCALLLAACLPAYLYLGSGIFHDMRFLLVAIPFVLILGAWFLDGIAVVTLRAYDRFRKREGAEWRHAVLVAMLLLTLVPHARGLTRQLERQRERDIRPELMLWMREELDTEAPCLDLYIGEQRFFAMQPVAVEFLSEEEVSDAMRQKLLGLRERYLASLDIKRLLRTSRGFEQFRSRLEKDAATRLIVISPLPRGSRGTKRELLHQALARFPRYGRYRLKSWSAESRREAVEYLAGLELEAFTVARDRRTRIWILKLP